MSRFTYKGSAEQKRGDFGGKWEIWRNPTIIQFSSTPKCLGEADRRTLKSQTIVGMRFEWFKQNVGNFDGETPFLHLRSA